MRFFKSTALVLKSLHSKALVVIPLVALPFAVQAHEFSTSFLTLGPSDQAEQLQWQWRFTEHDLEILVDSTDPEAAVAVLPQWLTLGNSCRLKPDGGFELGVHAGERTVTFSGTAPCTYSADLEATPHLIHQHLPDHKILR